MPDALKILIADDEPVIRMGLKVMLEEHGYKVVGEASDGEEAVALAQKAGPDLIFMDIKMPGLDGISAAATIMSRAPKPIILLTAWSERDLVQRAQEAGVLAYLVKPVREAELVPAIEIAMARFAELRTLQQEVGNLKDTLETRKLVERAKGILMTREGVDEQEAFQRIQRQSRNTRTPMREIARAILVSDELRRTVPSEPAARIVIRTPADLLRVLSGIRIVPGGSADADIMASGLEPLGYLRLTPGAEVTVEGYVTNRTREGIYGLGISFGLAPSPGDREGLVAAVIQNAVRPGALDAGGTAHSPYAQLLDEIITTQQRVTVSGFIRVLPDHASADHPDVPHIVELHPVRSVTTERGLVLPPIALDAPGGEDWTQVDAVHPMPFPDFQSPTRLAIAGAALTFRHAPAEETAYVYMTGRFFGGRSQFVEGRPFLFAFGDAPGRTRVTAVAVPGTLAYDMVRRWLSAPPTGPMTLVGLRALQIPALFAPGGGRIDAVLSPVFRILPGAVKGAGVPAPTARFELVPVGGTPPPASPPARRRPTRPMRPARPAQPRKAGAARRRKAAKPAAAAAKRGTAGKRRAPARRPPVRASSSRRQTRRRGR